VRLKGIDLKFRHSLADFAASDASGVVLFDDEGEGHASLKCLRLNGADVDQPVNIAVHFTPGDRLIFHEVRLSVPSMPLSALGLGDLLRQDVSRGHFAGTVAYREAGHAETVDVNGSLHGADLAELTGGVSGGPFRGTVDVDLDSATFQDRHLSTLSGHGAVSNLRIGELLPGFVRPSAEGRLDMQIDQLRWTGGRLAHLSARGACSDLALDALSSLWGQGRVTGTAALTIRSLLVVDDELRYGDVQIDAVPPDDGPGLLDRAIVARLAMEWLGVDLRAVLPEQIEYARLGARLVIDRGELRVFGTHGSEGKTILTIKLFGRPMELVRQPSKTFSVPDLVSVLRERADEMDATQVLKWWEHLHEREEARP
jgi:hypothetical protein